jgi:hypothetical protein
LVRPIADFVVSIGAGGVVTGHAQDVPEALVKEREPSVILGTELTGGKRSDQHVPSEASLKTNLSEDAKRACGKLIIAEEIHKGHIGSKAMKLFFTSLGGRHPFRFFSLWLAGHFISYCMVSFNLWFLGYWGSQYENHHAKEVPVIR